VIKLLVNSGADLNDIGHSNRNSGYYNFWLSYKYYLCYATVIIHWSLYHLKRGYCWPASEITMRKYMSYLRKENLERLLSLLLRKKLLLILNAEMKHYHNGEEIYW
jgi:hypothetical protein